jgi:hypothetical protein
VREFGCSEPEAEMIAEKAGEYKRKESYEGGRKKLVQVMKDRNQESYDSIETIWNDTVGYICGITGGEATKYQID